MNVVSSEPLGSNRAMPTRRVLLKSTNNPPATGPSVVGSIVSAYTVASKPRPESNEVSKPPSELSRAILPRNRKSTLLKSPPMITFCGPAGGICGVEPITAVRLPSYCHAVPEFALLP